MYKFLFSLTLLSSTLVVPAGAQQASVPAAASLQRLAQAGPVGLPGGEAARNTTSTVRVPGSAIHYKWMGNAWSDAVRIAYTYNAAARVTLEVESDSATAVPLARTITTYNPANAPTEIKTQSWDGTTWADDKRQLFTYDAQQALMQETAQAFNGTWVTTGGTRYLNAYDAANHLTEQVTQELDPTAQTFHNTARSLYVVGTTGHWTQETEQRWRGTAWEDTLRTTNMVWHNAAKGQLASADMQELDGGQWVTKARIAGTYSATMHTVVVREAQGSTFRNKLRLITNFNSRGDQTGTELETWAGVGWLLMQEKRSLLSYDAPGNLTRRIEQMHMPLLTNGFENMERYHYGNFQTIALASRATQLLAEALEAYPNPSADGHFTLHTRLPHATSTAVRVTDALGREVLRTAYAPTLDLSGQPAGLYTLELRTSSGVARRKIEIR